MYLNEIKELKKDNNRLLKVVYGLFALIVIILLGLTVYVTYNITVNNSAINVNDKTEEDSIQNVSPVKAEKFKY